MYYSLFAGYILVCLGLLSYACPGICFLVVLSMYWENTDAIILPLGPGDMYMWVGSGAGQAQGSPLH